MCRSKGSAQRGIGRHVSAAGSGGFPGGRNGLQGPEYLQRQGVLLPLALVTAGEPLPLSKNPYRSGSVSSLEIIDTQRTALQIARSVSCLQRPQMVTRTPLIKALGGGRQVL
ncbi:MAG: hypothetical protein C0619_01970 [Desulfuromonas sp.]|nr:MAG: hypothetical protein C0619_01970 [Desulfuromonas sp.]